MSTTSINCHENIRGFELNTWTQNEIIRDNNFGIDCTIMI